MSQTIFHARLLSLLLLGAGFAGCATSSSAPELSDRAMMAFERQDEDGDGVISEADIRAQSAQRFARIDADGSGAVSWDEYRNQPNAGRGGGRRGDPARSFSALDRDETGSLSQAELADGALRLFDAQDRNQDGEITEAEFAENMRRRRTPRRPEGAPPLPRS